LKYIHVDNDQKLVFSHTEIPSILADECLVQVKAIGVNRADILQRQGLYPPPKGESLILGLEVAGNIIQCGEQVNKWQVNDRVFGLVAGGAYAQYVVIKASQLFALPTHFSYAQGAATAEVFLTAYQCLFTIAKLEHDICSGVDACDVDNSVDDNIVNGNSKQKSVLIHAGASGVGSAAIQLAKAAKCYVVATVSNKGKLQACLDFGADDVINYQEVDFVKWTKSHHPQGFDVIIDVVGGDYLTRNIDVAALDSHIVMLAMLSGRYSQPLDIAKLLFKRINITASTLRNRSEQYKATLVANFTQQFYAQFLEKSIYPIIDHEYSWSDADHAHQKMLRNENIGKLVLLVNGDETD